MTEPVAFYDPHKGFYWAKPTKITAPVVVDVEPLALYTKRTWVGLTNEEVITMSRYDLECAALIGEVHRRLKERNT